MLVIVSVGFALNFLGAAVAVVFWGSIMAYNLAPEYDDNDVDINPLVRYAGVLGLVALVFVFILTRANATGVDPKELSGSLWSLGWWLLIVGFLFGSDDWDPATGQNKRKYIRTPGRRRRKQAAKQIIDERGGVIGETDRLGQDDRAGVPRRDR
jgi:hypothetical protein